MQINYLKIIQCGFLDFWFRFRLSQLKCTYDKKLQISTCFVSRKTCKIVSVSNTCSPHCMYIKTMEISHLGSFCWKVNLRGRDGARFPPKVTLGIEAKEFNFGFIRPCFSWFESSLGTFWLTPSGLSFAFYWGVASVWPLYHKGLIGGVLQRWLSFWKVLPSPQRWTSVRWPSGLGHLPDQALLPLLLSLAGSQL